MVPTCLRKKTNQTPEPEFWVRKIEKHPIMEYTKGKYDGQSMTVGYRFRNSNTGSARTANSHWYPLV